MYAFCFVYVDGKNLRNISTTQSYEYMTLIGKGGFGGVVRVRHVITKKTFAMKFMVLA